MAGYGSAACACGAAATFRWAGGGASCHACLLASSEAALAAQHGAQLEHGASGYAFEHESGAQTAARLRMASITGELAHRASYARAQGCTGREALLAAELTATGAELGSAESSRTARELIQEMRSALAFLRSEAAEAAASEARCARSWR